MLLRGLGDCRFERANETWGYDGGDAWTAAFSATWEGSAALPTLAFGNYLDLAKAEDRRDVRRQRARAARAPGGGRMPTPIPLTPGYCTLSILFSDWDRSGRARPADGERPALLPRRRGAAVAHRAKASRHALYTRDEGGSTVQIWGMGIASYDVTGDGLPEVYLTSQGDNKLQTLADATRPADLPGHRDRPGRDRARGRTRAATRCRPRHGIPSSRT